MSHGPSPLVPLLLVGAVGWITLGPQLLEGWSSVTEFQEAWYAPLVIAPIIVFLLVFLVSEIIVVPVVIVLAAALFKTVAIAPLILLLLAVLFFGVFRSNKNHYLIDDGSEFPAKDEGEGWFGFGAFMLLMLFLGLSSLFCEGECYWWISLMLLSPFVYFFSTGRD